MIKDNIPTIVQEFKNIAEITLGDLDYALNRSHLDKSAGSDGLIANLANYKHFCSDIRDFVYNMLIEALVIFE